jgi:Chromate resistance exported protein
MWSVLLLTLPTQPSAVRLRVWRALKTLGCASLRDGVCVLPASRTALFDALVTEVRAHGGQASVFELSTSDEAQRADVLGLFDRTEAYARWRTAAQTLAAALPGLAQAEAHRRWRVVSDALQALLRTDYYPGAAAEQAQAELDALRKALDARFSRGEPVAQAPHGIPRLDLRKFQGKRWATRARPWVDRLACAWLIRRFIDARAHFVWLADPAAATPAPRGAMGFDYDGARGACRR